MFNISLCFKPEVEKCKEVDQEKFGNNYSSESSLEIIENLWHSRRKLTFRRKNTKMSYLYHIVALTLLYILVLVALQFVILFPSYKGKWVDH